MDAWQAQLERVKQQLAAMSASQKMLVGTLVAVMAATVLYWGRFAAAPEQVAVLDQPLSESDIGQIDRQLDLSGVAHSVVNGKVMIAADRRAEVLANLMYAHALPADTHSAFEEMTAKQLNPFSSQTEREATYSHARELDLTAIIRRWPGVADASVVINNRNEHHLDHSDPPTATVDIRTRDAGDSGVDRRLAESAAAGVAAAVSGLKPDQVRVIIDGRTTRVQSRQSGEADGLAPGDVLEVQAREEAYLESKVRSQFAFIPGLNVTVTCDVQNQTRVEEIHNYDKGGAVSLPDYENNRSSEQHNADPAAREPGAATNDGTANAGGANGPASIDGGGGSMAGGPVSTSSTTTDELSHNQVFVPNTQAHVVTPGRQGDRPLGRGEHPDELRRPGRPPGQPGRQGPVPGHPPAGGRGRGRPPPPDGRQRRRAVRGHGADLRRHVRRARRRHGRPDPGRRRRAVGGPGDGRPGRPRKGDRRRYAGAGRPGPDVPHVPAVGRSPAVAQPVARPDGWTGGRRARRVRRRRRR